MTANTWCLVPAIRRGWKARTRTEWWARMENQNRMVDQGRVVDQSGGPESAAANLQLQESARHELLTMLLLTPASNCHCLANIVPL